MSRFQYLLQTICCVLAVAAVSCFGSQAMGAQTIVIQEEPAQALIGSEETEKAVPVFKDGESQEVEAFSNSQEWIQHDLWVETEFDSDDSGSNDRMHVSVTRQKQTDTEGLKVPVIYETSPYFAGISSTAPKFMWDPKHELGAESPKHENPPGIPYQNRRPSISNSHTKTWVPRGFAVVHSCSPGTGLSQGCPTVGGKNESLAPKAVIDWLNGRAAGFTTPDGDETVIRAREVVPGDPLSAPSPVSQPVAQPRNLLRGPTPSSDHERTVPTRRLQHPHPQRHRVARALSRRPRDSPGPRSSKVDRTTRLVRQDGLTPSGAKRSEPRKDWRPI